MQNCDLAFAFHPTKQAGEKYFLITGKSQMLKTSGPTGRNNFLFLDKETFSVLTRTDSINIHSEWLAEWNIGHMSLVLYPPACSSYFITFSL